MRMNNSSRQMWVMNLSLKQHRCFWFHQEDCSLLKTNEENECFKRHVFDNKPPRSISVSVLFAFNPFTILETPSDSILVSEKAWKTLFEKNLMWKNKLNSPSEQRVEFLVSAVEISAAPSGPIALTIKRGDWRRKAPKKGWKSNQPKLSEVMDELKWSALEISVQPVGPILFTYSNKNEEEHQRKQKPNYGTGSRLW